MRRRNEASKGYRVLFEGKRDGKVWMEEVVGIAAHGLSVCKKNGGKGMSCRERPINVCRKDGVKNGTCWLQDIYSERWEDREWKEGKWGGKMWWTVIVCIRKGELEGESGWLWGVCGGRGGKWRSDSHGATSGADRKLIAGHGSKSFSVKQELKNQKGHRSKGAILEEMEVTVAVERIGVSFYFSQR